MVGSTVAREIETENRSNWVTRIQRMDGGWNFKDGGTGPGQHSHLELGRREQKIKKINTGKFFVTKRH